MRRHANRIATARLANRGYINRRGTMPANDILTVLAIALGATNAARVQRSAITIRLFDDHEAQRLPSSADREQVHLAILHFADGNAYFVGSRVNWACRRRRGICAGVNEIRRKDENYGQETSRGRNHPTALPATLRYQQPFLRFAFGLFGRFRVGRGLPLTQHEQRRSAKNEHEEEKLIPDNRADDGHLRLARRQPLRF